MTYLDHFSLKEKPFKLSPDPRFMWFSEAHKEAWASLHFGVLDRRGFILLIGDVGTGKTTVINKLIQGLDENTLVARISDPGLEKLDFFRFLAAQFALETDFQTKGEFLIEMNLFLHRAYENQQNVVVIVDEAQRLTDEMLEEIRLLSNIERPDEKLINIVLVGQNELNQKLAKDDNRALRQRITTLYTIGPLARNEVQDFIRFRLKVAGTEEKVFTDRAVRAITVYSKGNPRLINVICDQALLTAFVQEKRRVDETIVQQCMRELTFALPRGRKKEQNAGHKEDAPSPGFHQDLPVQENHHAPPSQTGAERTASPLSKTWRRVLRTGSAIVVLFLLGLGGAYVYHPRLLEQLIAQAAPLQSVYQKYFSAREKAGQTIPGAVSDQAAAHPETRTEAIAGKQSEIPQTIGPRRSEQAQPAASDRARESGSERIVIPPPFELQAPEPDQRTGEDSLPAETISPAPPPLPSGSTVIQFPNNSNEVGDDSFQQLNQLAEIVKSRPGTRLIITGYTDGRGDETYNRNLSKFRADVIKSYFIGQGISSSQITSVGRGPENPIAPNDNSQGRSENRRVEVELVAPD